LWSCGRRSSRCSPSLCRSSGLGGLPLLRLQLTQLAFEHHNAIFQIAKPLLHRGLLVGGLPWRRILWWRSHCGSACNHHPKCKKMKTSQNDSSSDFVEEPF
jgi:hypothetical protein